MDLPGAANQWQRDAIVTANYESYGWYNSGAMNYSFTVADFPDAIAHPGFEAHLFLVNADTLASPGDATYGGVDWNAPDVMVARLENNANGSVDFSLRFKTNSPGANINNTVVTANGTTAIGTWTVAFTDNTSGTLTGPGRVSVPFTLP